MNRVIFDLILRRLKCWWLVVEWIKSVWMSGLTSYDWDSILLYTSSYWILTESYETWRILYMRWDVLERDMSLWLVDCFLRSWYFCFQCLVDLVEKRSELLGEHNFVRLDWWGRRYIFDCCSFCKIFNIESLNAKISWWHNTNIQVKLFGKNWINSNICNAYVIYWCLSFLWVQNN